jgi:hypothetical protein
VVWVKKHLGSFIVKMPEVPRFHKFVLRQTFYGTFFVSSVAFVRSVALWSWWVEENKVIEQHRQCVEGMRSIIVRGGGGGKRWRWFVNFVKREEGGGKRGKENEASW